MVRRPRPAYGPTMVILLGVLWIFAGSARAQQPPPPPGPQTPSPSTQPPQFAQQVDVVAVTPIHGVGLSKLKVPANVQVFSAEQVRLTVAPDVATLLKDRAAGTPRRARGHR